MDVRPFQVDLHGVVDLLSRHIYSGPGVYLRELLQNGRDAVAARRLLDPGSGPGRIVIVPAARPGEPLIFRDDGIGLDLAEANDLLATVGRSSKRDDLLDLRRTDYLGQFGVGLLSCFMVAEQIVVRSRSARGGVPVEWVGSADGTFTVRTLDDAELPVGTEVRLVARNDDAELLAPDRVHRLATRYGQYLPVPVTIVTPDGRSTTLTRPAPFLGEGGEGEDAVGRGSREELLELGTELLGARPLDVIELSVPRSGTRGVAFVLPSAPPPGRRQASRVYLGRMLLGERVDDLLPEWAFFVRCVLDTTGLRPTASREQLVADTELELTRAELGAQLRQWLLRTAATEPHRLAQIVAVHHVAMRAMAVHDDEFAATVIRWLTVETSAGTMTIDDYVRRVERVRYTETVDEFRQIAAVVPVDAPIVNGGYQYDADLLRRLPALLPNVTVEQVRVADELDNLDPPPLDDRAAVLRLESRAWAVLATSDVRVVVRVFDPADLPALYVADQEVLRRIERGRAATAAPALWSSVIEQIDDTITDRAASPDALRARLCLNWANLLVRRLAVLSDDVVAGRNLQLIYIQAMLAGHRALSPADRQMLTAALTDLVELSVGLDEGDRR